jgi:hypothetical protein
MVSQSNGIRSMSLLSPACSPLPVTPVPTTISTAVRPVSPNTARRRGVPTSGRGAASPSRARCQAIVVTVSSALAARKWAATMNGLSLVSTVTPPMTPLPITTQNWSQPSRVSSRRRGSAARAAMMNQPTAAETT